MARGDVDTALIHFREAVRIAPDFVAARNNYGNALRLHGDMVAALEQFREAVRRDPASAEARNNLGIILHDLGEVLEALVHCQEAVRLSPGFHAARTNLGNVLHTLGRLDEAAACFREAIRLQPTLAAAHAGLGGVLEELGHLDEAQASLREALGHDPSHAGAWARLATRLGDKLSAADQIAIEDLLADPNLSAGERWPLLFGLAHTRDARREFELAAALLTQANALQKNDFQARGRGYDPASHQSFVDRLIATFTPAFFERVRDLGMETERPVFIVGMPRSGTSLAEQVLASHPRAFGAGELRLVREAFETLPEVTGHRDRAPLDCVPDLERESLRLLGQRHLDALDALDGDADRVVDKMPENTLYLGLIAAMFPRARLIHCRRDLRDVALSCWMTHFAELRWACDPDHIASRISEYRRVMDHWRRVLPSPIFELEYEAMVDDLEGVSRRLLAWCGIDWDPVCLDFDRARRPVRTTSVAQVRRPIYFTSVGRWRNYEQSLAPMFAKLGAGR